jgi:hypothetical protein
VNALERMISCTILALKVSRRISWLVTKFSEIGFSAEGASFEECCHVSTEAKKQKIGISLASNMQYAYKQTQIRPTQPLIAREVAILQ